MHQNSPKCKRRGTPFAKNSHNANGNPIRQNCKGGNHSQKFNKMQRGNQLTKVKRADPILQRRNQRGTPFTKWKGGTLFTKVERGHPIHQNSPKCKREYPINQSAKGRPHSPKCKRGPHSRKWKRGTPFTKVQNGDPIHQNAMGESYPT